MQKILGYMRKAITIYEMLEDGDKVGIGVSGGKDSVILLIGMAKLRKFIGISFDIVAIIIDPMFGNHNTDYTIVKNLCLEYNIKCIIEKTNIGPIVFDYRQEKNPCSLCARMRRGVLHDVAKREGCNKIALGHHSDDWIETFIMNLFNEGRIGTFHPKTYLSIKEIYMIRPLIFIPEATIQSVVKKLKIPIVKSKCPAEGKSKREWTKNYLKDLEIQIPDIKQKILGAIIRLYNQK